MHRTVAATHVDATAGLRSTQSVWELIRRANGRPPMPSGPGHRIESFDCYRLAIEFAALAAQLVPRGHAALRDQLDRASASVALNLSEGWGRWQAREKAHFYAIARGSLLESGAAIDLVRARGLATAAECEHARALCTRVGQMLNGLIRAMERRSGERFARRSYR